MRLVSFKQIVLLNIILLHTALSGGHVSPDSAVYSTQITKLKARISSHTLSQQELRTTLHEIHRLLLTVYIIHSNEVVKESRLQAYHALTTLYYAPCSQQAALRDALTEFTAGLLKQDLKNLSYHARNEVVLQNSTLLEERMLPLLHDNPHTQTLIHKFTQSMFGLITHERITRKHIFLVGCLVVVIFAAILVMLILLDKLIETSEQTNQSIIHIDKNFAQFADKHTKLSEKPTLMQRVIIALIGNSTMARTAQTTRDAQGNGTQSR